jgi:hypothetical protein
LVSIKGRGNSFYENGNIVGLCTLTSADICRLSNNYGMSPGYGKGTLTQRPVATVV